MNGAEADRICVKLDRLTAEQGRTREEFAEMRGEVTAKIEGLTGSVQRLDKRLDAHEKNGQDRHTKTAERLTALETEQHCANPDTTGPRPAMASDISAELARVSQLPALPQAQPRGLSIPPSLAKHAGKLKLGGISISGATGALLLLAILKAMGVDVVAFLSHLFGG